MRQRKAKDLNKRLQACGAYMIEKPEAADSRRGSEGLRAAKRTTGASTVHTGEPLRGAAAAHDPAMDYFGPDREGRELFLEIGCGKGQFITSKALEHPESDFIAIEGQETVILRALEKAREIDERLAAGNPEESAAECAESAESGEYTESAESDEEPRRLHPRQRDAGCLSNLKFMLTFVHSMDELFYENQLSGIYLNFSDPWPKARHAKRRLTYRGRLTDYAWALKPGGFVEVKTDNDALYDFTLEEIEAAGYKIEEQTRDLHASGFEAKKTTTEYEDKFSSRGKNINYVRFTV